MFRTAVLRKLFDIRFSYKHTFRLLVKMASNAVTRSISSIQFYAAFFSVLCKLIHLSLIAFIIGSGL